MTSTKKKSLGESLVEDGIITAEQLKQAKIEEKRTGLRLRKVFVKMGLITEEDLVLFLSDRLGLPRIELNNYLIDPAIIDLVPEELARKYELIPVLKIGNRLTCAMVDPWNVFALDEVRARTHFIVDPAVATEDEVTRALSEHYGARGTMEEIIQTIDAKKIGLKEEHEIDVKALEGVGKEPIVVKLVNLVIMKALKEGASDIHIEPEEEFLKLRFRVDGMLHEVSSPPKHLQSAIISRIKIMADLDIAERRIPQDGRFSIKIEAKEIDVRVSCVPTIYGENIVLRLLDVSSAMLGLPELGFPRTMLEKYKKLITREHGIVLVTGPTGSGKTTTLYASLDKINVVEKNIITIEDPVEYRLGGIRQIQVNPKVDLTFARSLRSVLRQDPDVIMVGEIRDLETAEIAIHAALTGHLVFSTLHTNDACAAVTRLIDMGVESYLVASSVVGILAQRLLRIICQACRQEYTPSEEALQEVGLWDDARARQTAGKTKIKFARGKGCPQCGHSGYKGRVSIFELLVLDEKIRDLIVAKAPLADLQNQARAQGMVTLKEDGLAKIEAGLTTIEEVLRVTQED